MAKVKYNTYIKTFSMRKLVVHVMIRKNEIVPYVAHALKNVLLYNVCRLNIGVFHLSISFNPCFPAFYSILAFKSYIPPTFS